jgi:hypothetical protein
MNDTLKPVFAVISLILPLLGPAAADNAAKVWKSATFLDRVDGTLADGGANTYVAADGSIRLIHVTDLNRDGYVDLVAPTDHSQSDGRVDLSIYWGKSGWGRPGGSPAAATRLPTDRARAVAAADLDGDGHLDLVVANAGSDPWRPIDSGETSYIYWGTQKGFSAQRRTELPTQAAYSIAIADLDGDGSLDLVFANLGNTISADHFNKSYVYWGDKGRYDPVRRSVLRTEKATDVVVADVNRDGFQDVLFSQEGNVSARGGVLIYWGGAVRSALGEKLTRLPGESSSALAVGDLNADGFPEIVVANEYRTYGREANGVYTIDNEVQLNSYVYWGSGAGYSLNRRTALPTLKATGVALGDLNGDGRPDIVFANSSGGVGYGGSMVEGATTSTRLGGGQGYVYWNLPEGFAPHRRTALPTSYGTACAVADVNRDGYPDVVFASQSDGHSYDVDSYVYWGGPAGLGVERRTSLPTFGASGVLVADLDGDGKPDVVFANSHQNSVAGNRNSQRIYWGNEKGEFSESRMQAIPLGAGYNAAGSYSTVDVNADGYIDLTFSGPVPVTYWGGPQGFTPDNKTPISGRYSFYGTFADFNRDGYLDYVCSEFFPGSTDTRVYFGSPTGFSPSSRFTFHVNGPRASTVADLNRDGWLDVVFATMSDSRSLVIFWGGPDGFDNERKLMLPIGMAPAARAADLNRDGYLDLVVANLFDPQAAPGPAQQQHAFGGSTDGGAIIYWGGPAGYSARRRQVLPGIGLEDLSIADLNSDGYLDFAASHYSGSPDRKHPSYVYWNGPNGFSAEHVTLLPTFAASGVAIADFNRDGFRDIRFANHVKDSHHDVSNFIYWGSAAGFSESRRSEVHDPGPHLLSGHDVGNVYDRSDRYDYVSPPFDTGQTSRFESLRWEGETPFRTRLEFQARTAATRDELAKAAWSGPAAPGSFHPGSGEALRVGPGRWIQYKATLVSPDDANTPVLRAVSISYR